jgi:hypothetical protein
VFWQLIICRLWSFVTGLNVAELQLGEDEEEEAEVNGRSVDGGKVPAATTRVSGDGPKRRSVGSRPDGGAARASAERKRRSVEAAAAAAGKMGSSGDASGLHRSITLHRAMTGANKNLTGIEERETGNLRCGAVCLSLLAYGLKPCYSNAPSYPSWRQVTASWLVCVSFQQLSVSHCRNASCCCVSPGAISRSWEVLARYGSAGGGWPVFFAMITLLALEQVGASVDDQDKQAIDSPTARAV